MRAQEDTPRLPRHEQPPRPRSIFRRVLFTVLCLVLFVAVADIALRITGWGSAAYQQPRFLPKVPFTQIPKGPLVYQPNQSFESHYDPAGDTRHYFGPNGIITYQLNSMGARGRDVAEGKPPGTFRVLCLGDSFTFGEGAKEADTYPAVLQSLLTKSRTGSLEVINAGVQGYDTRDEAALYLMRYAKFKPDVVILGFVLNDATDSGETTRQNEATRSDLPLSRFARTWKLAEIYERRRAARRLQDEYFETTRRSFESPKWDTCKQVLAGMSHVAKEDHFRFIVVIFPIFWQLDENYPFADIHAKIAAACRDAGCEYIDLLDTYRGRDAESLWVHPTDQHPNEIAHRMAAERIAAYLTAPSK